MRWRELVPWKTSGSNIALRGERTPFGALQGEINKVFESFFNGFPFENAPQTWRSVEQFTPKINVEETDTEITVKAELPGMEEKDVHLTLGKDYLTIEGERKHEQERKEGGTSYYESAYGSFHRTIPLDVEVESDKVDAAMKKGVLTIRLPKTQMARKESKKIAVRAA